MLNWLVASCQVDAPETTNGKSSSQKESLKLSQ